MKPTSYFFVVFTLITSLFNPAMAAEAMTVAPAKYASLYALSGYNFTDLAVNNSAQVYVVDVDDSHLTAAQVGALRQAGRVVFSYLSIGEAENYRSYWPREWNSKAKRPDYILDENKDWKGNFRVKFWDAGWQKLMIDRAQQIARMGYHGVYLDIVDGYQQKSVIKAYRGGEAKLRKEMENFVIRISQATKAVNPRFKIIPQNAAELVTDADDDTRPNAAYLAAIDGLGIEDLWFVDNKASEWTKWDLPPVKLARAQGKFILATSYPSKEKIQQEFVQKALKEGFIPYAAHRSLGKKDGTYPINLKTPALLPASWINQLR